MTNLWVEAETDLVTERHEQRLTAARIAAADITSSLARAGSKTEFENRKAVFSSRLDDICKRLAAGDPASYAVLRSDLEGSLDHDREVIEAALQVEAADGEWTQEGDAWVYRSGGRKLRATEKGWSISNPTGVENSGVATSIEEAKTQGLAALPGEHQKKDSTLHEAYGGYADDPYWIDQVKYPGRCAKCAAEIPRGARAWYWPLSKKSGRNPLECEKCGETSATRFAAESFDDDVMSRGLASRTAASHNDDSGKYRAEVAGVNENVWTTNGLSYDTEEEAKAWLDDLKFRWTGYDMARVVPNDTPKRQPVDHGETHYQNFRASKQAAALDTQWLDGFNAGRTAADSPFALTASVDASDRGGLYEAGFDAGWEAQLRIGAFRKGAPFADYKDFDACVAANSDKDDPEAYCGKIKHQVEDSKESSLQVEAAKCAHCEQGNHTGTNGTPGCSGGSCTCSCRNDKTAKSTPPWLDKDEDDDTKSDDSDGDDAKDKDDDSQSDDDGSDDDDAKDTDDKKGHNKFPFAKGGSVRVLALSFSGQEFVTGMTKGPSHCIRCANTFEHPIEAYVRPGESGIGPATSTDSQPIVCRWCGTDINRGHDTFGNSIGVDGMPITSAINVGTKVRVIASGDVGFIVPGGEGAQNKVAMEGNSNLTVMATDGELEVLDAHEASLHEAAGSSLPLRCNECDKRFKRSIGPKTYEVKCPRCGGYDTEPDYEHPEGHKWGSKTAGDKPPWLDKNNDGDKNDANPDEQPEEKPEGDISDQSDSSHLDPSQMQAGQALTVDYTLTGSAAGSGNCPATFESFDGTTAYFTYEGGRFAVTQQGGKWVDAAGTEFDFQMSGDPAQPPVDPNQPPVQTQPPQPPQPAQQQKPPNPFEKKKSVLVESLTRTIADLDPEERAEVMVTAMHMLANPYTDENPFGQGADPANPTTPGKRPLTTKPRQMPKGVPPTPPPAPGAPGVMAPVVQDDNLQQGFR